MTEITLTFTSGRRLDVEIAENFAASTLEEVQEQAMECLEGNQEGPYNPDGQSDEDDMPTPEQIWDAYVLEVSSDDISGVNKDNLSDWLPYLLWVSNSDHKNKVAIAEAAEELDIDADNIDDCYQGEFANEAAFAEHLATNMSELPAIPDWIRIDWAGTWEYSLRYDYSHENGHFFRDI